mgnify:CR=1 FL=1
MPNDDKLSVSFRLSKRLVDEVRQFVRDQAGAPRYLKLGDFAEAALAAHLERMREELDAVPVRRIGRMARRQDRINNSHTPSLNSPS